MKAWRLSATPSPSVSRNKVMRLALTPSAGGTPHRRLHRVAEHVLDRSGDLGGLGDEDVAPLGSTWIQRGCFKPVANALTLSPGAATGIRPSLHPLAVGILSVGIPCGLAAGTTGALPQAG